ncbi:hypothetical protein VdG1_05303 [Verticillium dahliae VDG1]|nr:hypothetical protein VdG1_05303 [Verticillium dahliae VDG1]
MGRTRSLATAANGKDKDKDEDSMLDGQPAPWRSSPFGTLSPESACQTSACYWIMTNYRAGQYLLPNDDKEQDRLDLTHHVFSLTLHGELCISHLENPRRILDLGTGTGIWAIDAGDQFPAAEVIGTDLSPIQSSWVPPNVRFEVDDATLPWTWPRDHFDFVHARTLGGAIKDWPTLLRQLGGWTNEEAQVLFAMVRDEMKTNKVHLYTYTAFVTGRKPTTATS